MFYKFQRLLWVESFFPLCKTVHLQSNHMEKSSRHPRRLFQQAKKRIVSLFLDLSSCAIPLPLVIAAVPLWHLEMVLAVFGSRSRRQSCEQQPTCSFAMKKAQGSCSDLHPVLSAQTCSTGTAWFEGIISMPKSLFLQWLLASLLVPMVT